MEILDDIRKLLDKAIDDIDDTAMHPNKYVIDPNKPDKVKKTDEARFPEFGKKSRRFCKTLSAGIEIASR